jgi:hypothetical protein
MQGARVLDSVPLGFAASGAPLTRESQTSSLGSAAPLEAWTAGIEEGAVTTAFEPVRLGPERTGVVVHQAAGFEHVKRRHDVFVADSGKLRLVWTAAEPQGPTRIAAHVVPQGTSDAIVRITGRYADDPLADSVGAERFVWDESTGQMAGQPVEQLSAVITGEYATPALARAARAGECVADSWVMPAELFGGRPRRYVLAVLLGNAEVVSQEVNRSCDPGLSRRAATFQPPRARRMA